MTEKWVVGFEIDLRNGVCVLARKEAGEGDVAVFPSRDAAEEWVKSSGEIDEEGYILVSDFSTMRKPTKR